MTNLEKYKEELEPYVYAQTHWCMSEGKFVRCSMLDCTKCLFYNNGDCDESKFDWLKEEYKEPEIDWSKVATDTPILVSKDGVEWKKRHFAEYKNGKVCTWDFGCTSWSGKFLLITEWKYAKLANMEDK